MRGLERDRYYLYHPRWGHNYRKALEKQQNTEQPCKFTEKTLRRLQKHDQVIDPFQHHQNDNDATSMACRPGTAGAPSQIKAGRGAVALQPFVPVG
jgi:hypothetical protein